MAEVYKQLTFEKKRMACRRLWAQAASSFQERKRQKTPLSLEHHFVFFSVLFLRMLGRD